MTIPHPQQYRPALTYLASFVRRRSNQQSRWWCQQIRTYHDSGRSTFLDLCPSSSTAAVVVSRVQTVDDPGILRRSPYLQLVASRCLSLSSSSSAATPSSVDASDSWIPLTEALQRQIDAGHWRPDPAQRRAAKKLERLQNALPGYSNEPLLQAWDERRRRQQQEQEAAVTKQNNDNDTQNEEREGNSSNDSVTANQTAVNQKTNKSPVHQSTSPAPMKIPRGLYLHGSVGVGKSWLMDFFFRHAPTAINRKQRFHFHEFMADVHRRVHQLQQHQLQTHGRSFHPDVHFHPIRMVAEQFARETSLLCLDEFQVTDIADAVILQQLFETLWMLGTVVVATSNGAPHQLYEGGLNRFAFLPFIDLLERHMVVHNLSSDMDYRIVLSQEDTRRGFYAHQEDSQAVQTFESVIVKLRGDDAELLTDQSIPVTASRSVTVSRSDTEGRVAECTWNDLCSNEYGASDYRALAQHFDVLAMTDIPIMSLEQQPNESKRFVTLLDELYESKSTAFMCLAAHEDPFELFQGRRKRNSSSTKNDEDKDDDTSSTWEEDIALGIDQAEQEGHSVGALASIRELSVAYNRAASRIVEMTSPRWWDQVLNTAEVVPTSSSSNNEKKMMNEWDNKGTTGAPTTIEEK